VAVYRAVLPLPPSVNHMYARQRRGVYLTPKARQWWSDALIVLRQAGFHPLPVGRYRVSLELHFYLAYRSDASNRIKFAEDAIAGSLGLNDRDVFDGRWHKTVTPRIKDRRLELSCTVVPVEAPRG